VKYVFRINVLEKTNVDNVSINVVVFLKMILQKERSAVILGWREYYII